MNSVVLIKWLYLSDFTNVSLISIIMFLWLFYFFLCHLNNKFAKLKCNFWLCSKYLEWIIYALSCVLIFPQLLLFFLLLTTKLHNSNIAYLLQITMEVSHTNNSFITFYPYLHFFKIKSSSIWFHGREGT